MARGRNSYQAALPSVRIVFPRHPHRPVWRLDTAAVTSVLLAALTCLLGVYAPFNYEPAPIVNLPFTRNQSSGCYLFDGPGVVIRADAAERLYFSHYNRAIQTETIRRVAAQHGVQLNNPQLAELRKLAYLGLDAHYLPAYLALSAQERQQIKLLGFSVDAGHNELAEYLAVSRTVALEQTAYHRPYVVLAFDKDLPMGTVRHIMRILQQQGIHRCYYAAWMP